MNVDNNKNNNQDCEIFIVDNLYANRQIRIYDDYCPTLRSERFGLLVVEEFFETN